MKVPRTPLLFILAGFLGGVIISRNAAPLDNASRGGIVLSLLVGGFILWRAGYRGKREAVAVAVSTAVATAVADATANANASAQQAVQIVMQARAEHGELDPPQFTITDMPRAEIEPTGHRNGDNGSRIGSSRKGKRSIQTVQAATDRSTDHDRSEDSQDDYARDDARG